MNEHFPELVLHIKANQSPLTPAAVGYTWRQLAQRAGVTDGDPDGHGFEALDLPVYYRDPVEAQGGRPGLYIVPCRASAWEDLLRCPPQRLDWHPITDLFPPGFQPEFRELTPVLFWGAGYEDGQKPFVEHRPDGSVVFYADILAASFFMLSRWEETVVLNRDAHGRFPARASVAGRHGFGTTGC